MRRRQEGYISAAMLGIGKRSGGAAAFTCDSADFDGTNDYASRGADLGASDSKLGLFCFWARLDGGDGVNFAAFSASSALGGGFARFRVFRTNLNVWQFQASDSGGASRLDLRSTNTYTAGATWLWVAASWDVSDVTKRHLYVGDTADMTVTTFTNTTLDYTWPDWALGGFPGGTNKFNGCLAEEFFFPGVYLDLSVQANRRLFYSAAGKPVDPNASGGAFATLGFPAAYFHLNDGETANNFAANDDGGTGGAFTVTGTLTTGSTSPSD